VIFLCSLFLSLPPWPRTSESRRPPFLSPSSGPPSRRHLHTIHRYFIYSSDYVGSLPRVRACLSAGSLTFPDMEAASVHSRPHLHENPHGCASPIGAPRRQPFRLVLFFCCGVGPATATSRLAVRFRKPSLRFVFVFSPLAAPI